ncbi:hypothetical protein I352_03335 [Cryptococcus deuterogattii MMRL2647]|nr:hypothetical protein I352_03335 [Cryptococcus deuterogattii MMRL2647]
MNSWTDCTFVSNYYIINSHLLSSLTTSGYLQGQGQSTGASSFRRLSAHHF